MILPLLAAAALGFQSTAAKTSGTTTALSKARWRNFMSIPGHNDTSGFFSFGEILHTQILFPAGESQPIYFLHENPYQRGVWLTKWTFDTAGRPTRAYRQPMYHSKGRIAASFDGALARLMLDEEGRYIPEGKSGREVDRDLRLRRRYALYVFPARGFMLQVSLVQANGYSPEPADLTVQCNGHLDPLLKRTGWPICPAEQKLIKRGPASSRRSVRL